MPVPPINTAGTVESANQAGETKGPLVNAGDPNKDAQSNDVDVKKEQVADKIKQFQDSVIAANQMKKDAAVKAPEPKHPELAAPTPAKVIHATSAPANVQSGSVGTLMGKMKSESEAVHEKIEMALRDHNLMENNIPLSHPYWGWLNEYRLLRGQGK